MIIKDPEVAKLFADDTRRQILHNLRHHELSATDLAKALRKTHSSIIHHLKLLQESGLVEETRVEKKRNLVQSYYGSTARRFLISYSLSESLESSDIFSWQIEVLKKVIEDLDAFGIEIPGGRREEVLRLLADYYIKERKALEESVEGQVRPVKLERPVYAAMIRLLTHLKLAKDKEYRKLIDDLGNLLTFHSKGEANT
jgi:DNA-binding transcriptional ArsR family regulator